MSKNQKFGWIVIKDRNNVNERIELKQSNLSCLKNVSINNIEFIISEESMRKTNNINLNKINKINKIFGI